MSQAPKGSFEVRSFRFFKEELRAYNKAKAKDQKLSEWVRDTLNKAAKVQTKEITPP